jgi:hypothetical protein
MFAERQIVSGLPFFVAVHRRQRLKAPGDFFPGLTVFNFLILLYPSISKISTQFFLLNCFFILFMLSKKGVEDAQ